MPTTHSAGHPIGYQTRGDGHPVLLIPGMAATSDWFAFNIPAFARRYRVVAQDLRGANRDGVPEASGPYSTRDMAADSIAVLDELGIDRAHVVAQSMGGMVAQWLLLDHPSRVARVSIVGNGIARTPEEMIASVPADFEPPPPPPADQPPPMTFTPQFPHREPQRWKYYVDHIGSRPPHPKTLRAQVFAALRHDTVDRLGEVRHPVQLLIGEHDTVNVAQAPRFADAMPDGRLSILPGMAHALNLEFADEYNALVLGFLGDAG